MDHLNLSQFKQAEEILTSLQSKASDDKQWQAFLNHQLAKTSLKATNLKTALTL